MAKLTSLTATTDAEELRHARRRRSSGRGPVPPRRSRPAPRQTGWPAEARGCDRAAARGRRRADSAASLIGRSPAAIPPARRSEADRGPADVDAHDAERATARGSSLARRRCGRPTRTASRTRRSAASWATARRRRPAPLRAPARRATSSTTPIAANARRSVRLDAAIEIAVSAAETANADTTIRNRTSIQLPKPSGPASSNV